MPLEQAAQPAVGQTIKYARAAYDVERDGGTVGLHYPPSQLVPADALILGAAYQSQNGFSIEQDAVLNVLVGPHYVAQFPEVDVDWSKVAFGTYPQSALDNSLPIVVEVADAAINGGNAFIYVIYV